MCWSVRLELSLLFVFIVVLACDPQTVQSRLSKSGNGSAHVFRTAAGEEAFIDWARTHSIRLKTVEAGQGFDDMQKLAEVIGDARLVALGEATHGTREFFQLKHRMIEFLASQKGFTIFSIEASMPEAYRLNDYVLHGKGNPRDLLKGMYFWTWNTQEVLAMVEWMRQLNQSGKGHIEFTGFDMQFPAVPLDRVRKFVSANDPEYLTNLEFTSPDVSHVTEHPLSTLPLKGNKDLGQMNRALSLVRRCQELINHIESNRDFYLSQGSTPSEIEWTVQNAELVLQYAQLKAGSKTRDESMAENVKWITEHNPGAKLVLWAHNGHIMHRASFGYEPMGSYLSKWFGKEYVNFGFAFDEGSFRAVGADRQLREFSVDPAPKGSFDRALASTGIPVLAIDLRQLPSHGTATDWMGYPRLTRLIGAVYSEERAKDYFGSMKLQDAYDVLLFVSKTTAAKGN